MGREEKLNGRSRWRRKHNPVPIPYPNINKPNFVPKAEVIIETPFFDRLNEVFNNWVTRVRKGNESPKGEANV